MRCDQAVSDSRVMHLDAEKVGCGIIDGELHKRFAVAKTDFEYSRRGAIEDRVKIQQMRCEINSVFRPQFIKCALLR